MVPCYDCGQKIPDEEIIRCTVRTGPKVWVSIGGRGPRSYYRKVNLCPACAEQRDRDTKKATKTFLIVLLVVGGSLLALCLVGGLIAMLSLLARNIHQPLNPKPTPTRKTQQGLQEVGKSAPTPVEDASVQEVLISLKSQDKAVRERGVINVIQNAKNWKPDSCTKVARELASIRDNKFQVSRALCEIAAILEPPPLAPEIEKQPQQVALESLKTINPPLHNLVVEFLTIKFAQRGKVAKKLVNLEDGKAAIPLLQGYITDYANPKWGSVHAYNSGPFKPGHGNTFRQRPFYGFEQELEDCLRVLMALAPEEPSTFDAVFELVRYYYVKWSKQGYRAEKFEEQHIIYFMEQLATFGKEAKQVTPFLQGLTFDKSENIKGAAVRLLQQITHD